MADAPPSAPAAAPAAEAPVISPGAPAQAQPPGAAPAPTEPERDPNLPPRYAELGKTSQQRLAQRNEQAKRDQDTKDAEAWRAHQAGQGQRPHPQAVPQPTPQASKARRVEIDPDDPGSLRAAFAGDDAAFRRFLNDTARHVANPDAVRFERELAGLKGKLPEDYEDLRATVTTMQQERQAEKLAHVESKFIEGTEAKVKGDDGTESLRFPLLTRLAPETRIQHAHGMIAHYLEQGYTREEISAQGNDFICEQVEAYLADFGKTLFPTPTPTPLAPVAETTATKRPQGTTSKRSSQGTRSLTHDLANPRTSERRLTPEERTELAKRNHALRRAARS